MDGDEASRDDGDDWQAGMRTTLEAAKINTGRDILLWYLGFIHIIKISRLVISQVAGLEN